MIQGTDAKVRFTLTDGTSPIQPSALYNYAIDVYHLASGKKTQLATFLKSNTGLFSIVVFNDSLGKIDIILNRNLTAKFPIGDIYGEVSIMETATSDFILSKSKNGATAIFIDTVEASANSILIA
jgi:hypothetical protein